jgi:hypothetical protein
MPPPPPTQSTVTRVGLMYIDMLEKFMPITFWNKWVVMRCYSKEAGRWVCELDLLDRKFPRKLNGGGGPITWPSRAPDLTTYDLFFWLYIKNAATFHLSPPLSRNLLRGYGLLRLQLYPPYLTNVWTELQSHMVCAGLPTQSVTNICKLLNSITKPTKIRSVFTLVPLTSWALLH